MFKVSHISLLQDVINIKFNSSTEFDNIKFILRVRDIERFVLPIYKQQYELDVNSNGKNHEINFNIKLIEENLNLNSPSNEIIWIYLYDGKKYYELKIDDIIKQTIRNEKIVNLNLISKFKLLARANNTLGFQVIKQQLITKVKDININDSNILLHVEAYIKESNTLIDVNKITLSKRMFKNTFKYQKELEFNRVNEELFMLDINSINKFSLEKVNNFDFIAYFQNGNISVKSTIKMEKDLLKKIDSYLINKKYNSKIYLTAANTLAYKVEEINYSICASKLNIHNSIMSIELDCEDIQSEYSNLNKENIELKILRCNKIINDYEYVPYKIINYSLDDCKLKANISIKELFGSIRTNYIQTYKVALEINDNNNKILYDISIDSPTYYDIVNEHNKLRVNVNSECIINVNPEKKENVKLAILGTCFSRAAFNSNDDYHNKDYKRYFEISYSHFWFSIISCMSEPLEFNRDNFKDISDKEIQNINRVYNKTDFEEMKETQFDYLIIDFFVDAIHGVRLFEDGKILAPNVTLNKSEYYKNNILNETIQFDYRSENYFDVWKNKCDEFIKGISQVIDEDKIILNLGGLTDEYYDKNGQRKSYIETKKFTKSELNCFNLVWNRMNNYFLSKLPNAKVIDMDKYEFIGSEEHPITPGPHHYEHTYYKSYIGELSKALTYFLNN